MIFKKSYRVDDYPCGLGGKRSRRRRCCPEETAILTSWMCSCRQTDRDNHTETDRLKTDRPKDKQDRPTETDRPRQTDRDGQTETDRPRQTGSDSTSCCFPITNPYPRGVLLTHSPFNLCGLLPRCEYCTVNHNMLPYWNRQICQSTPKDAAMPN